MKTIKTIIALCAIALNAESQNSYGTTAYPHTNSKLCSGTVTAINPGFLMAGYELTNSISGYNFTLDRMDIGGVNTGSNWNFQKGYTLFGGGSLCPIISPQIFNCAGVSIIEKTNFSTYGLAGAMDYGCFFAAFDNAGVVTQAKSYVFPVTPNVVTKPLITESLIHTDEYYIVGAFDGIMYILRVDTAGVIQANYTSNVSSTHSLFPTAIMESPYGTSPLTIVGYLTDNTTGQDGFFYQIPNTLPTTGATVFNRYDISNTNGINNVFSSIVLANATSPGSAGFLVGGGSVSGNTSSPGNAWMLKLSPTGGVIWSTVIDGTTDPISGKIHGVIERNSTFNSIYECYGACEANSGITVYKLDQTGIPFNVNYAGNDEFVYNSGSSSNTWPVNMTYNQVGSANDDGLHIYGNLDITGPGNHYLVQAYFSGQDGCNTPLTIAAYDQTAPSVNAVTDASGASLTSCLFFNITSTPLNTYNALCGPVSSVGGGSNNRLTALAGELPTAETNDLSIYPNPVTNKTKISYTCLNSNDVNISLYNTMGQLVKVISNQTTKVGETETIEIDFDNLGLDKGVYLIKAINGSVTFRQKIIYMKE